MAQKKKKKNLTFSCQNIFFVFVKYSEQTKTNTLDKNKPAVIITSLATFPRYLK